MTEKFCVTEPDGTISFAAVYLGQRGNGLWRVEMTHATDVLSIEKTDLDLWEDMTTSLACYREGDTEAEARAFFELLKTEEGRRRDREFWAREPGYVCPDGERWPLDFLTRHEGTG